MARSRVRQLNRASPLFRLIKFGRILKQLITAANEVITDHATTKTSVDEGKTLLDELHDDHATYKAVVDELKTWAEALATKLNADAGVTDTDYDATITNSAPATLTAAKPTAGPASLSAGSIDDIDGDIGD